MIYREHFSSYFHGSNLFLWKVITMSWSGQSRSIVSTSTFYLTVLTLFNDRVTWRSIRMREPQSCWDRWIMVITHSLLNEVNSLFIKQQLMMFERSKTYWLHHQASIKTKSFSSVSHLTYREMNGNFVTQAMLCSWILSNRDFNDLEFPIRSIISIIIIQMEIHKSFTLPAVKSSSLLLFDLTKDELFYITFTLRIYQQSSNSQLVNFIDRSSCSDWSLSILHW